MNESRLLRVGTIVTAIALALALAAPLAAAIEPGRLFQPEAQAMRQHVDRVPLSPANPALALWPDAEAGIADAEPSLTENARRYDKLFVSAAEEFDVPVEVLQALALVESGWDQREDHVHESHSDSDSKHRQPASYGLMGLRDDAHFGHSLREAANLIRRDPHDLKRDAEANVRGAAALLSALSGGKSRSDSIEEWEEALSLFSGIPQPDVAQIHTYDILNSIRLGRSGVGHRVQHRPVDLQAVYGEKRLRELSAPNQMMQKSTDYGPALWNSAATCNFSSGRSSSVTHIAIHIMEGTYAGSISWFKNCASSVSAHYLIRKSDGQVTQMVRERDTAYHISSHNSYTIGIEHEGYASNPGDYTAVQYSASAALVRHLAARYGIPLSATYDASLGWSTEIPRNSHFKIKGHTNFPTTKTCPGRYWDWPRYRSLVMGGGGGTIKVDDLHAVKLNGTSSGKTEVHSLARSSGYSSFNLHTASGFGQVWPADYSFYFADYNRNGRSDMFGVSRAGTTWHSSTRVTVRSAASNFVTALFDGYTPIGLTSDTQFEFALGDYNRDGVPDLYAIVMNGTASGKTEVHILSGASNYRTYLLHAATPLGTTTRTKHAFRIGDYNRNGVPDIYAIAMNGTGSGKTEVHVLSGSAGYKSWLLHVAIPLGEISPNTFDVQLGNYDTDGIADLFFISREAYGVWSSTAVFVYSGASNYQRPLRTIVTPLERTRPWQWRFGTGHR